MRVLLTSEARFERTPDGMIWGPPAYGRALWTRYLDVFSTVLIVARVTDVPEACAGSVSASQPDVQFWPLPAYCGLPELVRNLHRLRTGVARAVRDSDAVIVRAPSPLAHLTARAAARAGRSFAAEVVGDPSQVFSPGAFQHPLRAPIRYAATAMQRQLCRDATAVLYVTSHVLQRRYPTRGRMYAASDVMLDDQAFGGEDRCEWNPPANFVLVTVGGLDQPYKGTSVLLRAVREARKNGAAVNLRIVGSGRLMRQYQQECETLGLSADVEFLGQQDRAGVRDALDSAHLFVLPSLTEGLPRALLEAMARRLPAIATDVGGIPELLPPECLVPPRDAHALAERIQQLMSNEWGRRWLGERNRAHARKYHERLQAVVRRDFLNAVKDTTAAGGREVRCA